MDISINIVESVDDISKKILKALLPQVTSYFQEVFDKSKNNINQTISTAIINSPEYQSLLSGKLKYEFGLPDSDTRLATILSIISNIQAKYTKPKITKNQIQGSVALSMIPSDYNELLSSSIRKSLYSVS
jgi:predicted house-cleaning noncanonical NTP pyrophosphatase (MazG superfamily)